METKEKENLLEYLKTAIALETDLETQRQLKENCTAIMEQKMPTFTEKTCPPLPDTDAYYESRRTYLIMLIGGISIAIGMLAIAAMPGGGFVFVFAVLFFLLSYYPYYKLRQVNADQDKDLQFYYDNCAKIKAENEKEKEIYHNQLSHWKQSNEDILQSLNAPTQQTLQIRDELYAKNVIYPKYQTLPALTSIYEYFITGRCDELSGPHGAYNLYEDEVRKDTVISQINIVIKNLEQIKQNQYQLYQQVKTIQKTTQLIGSELTKIKGYTITLAELTALNTYYNSLTARNSSAAAFLLR